MIHELFDPPWVNECDVGDIIPPILYKSFPI